MGFFDDIDMTKEQKEASAINLLKAGDKVSVDLRKRTGQIHINLKWDTSVKKKGLFGLLSKEGIDLDLGCMYRLKNKRQGVIQALGNSFGSLTAEPFINLDKDDRAGNSADGENLIIARPELIDTIVVFAFIYGGTPNWSQAKGIVTFKQQGGPEIIINLDNPDDKKIMCSLVKLVNLDGQLELSKVEKYYQGHEELDKDFGFGFNWRPGKKD